MFVVSDTHFFHKNIIDYCDRPFKDVTRMNSKIVKNWNKVVGKYDVVFHLGDVGFGTKKEMQSIVNKLNGYKILILGNHDKRRGINWWLDIGFQEVHKEPIGFSEVILSHEPLNENRLYEYNFNVHGHTHNKYAEGDKYINVSIDVTDFKPIKLSKIIDQRFMGGVYWQDY